MKFYPTLILAGGLFWLASCNNSPAKEDTTQTDSTKYQKTAAEQAKIDSTTLTPEEIAALNSLNTSTLAKVKILSAEEQATLNERLAVRQEIMDEIAKGKDMKTELAKIDAEIKVIKGE